MSTSAWNFRPIDDVWLPFLSDIDLALELPVTLHVVGGFALTTLVDAPRPTGDIDFVEALPYDGRARILEIGCEGSNLARKHSLCFHAVGIADPPCNYEGRLIDVTPSGLANLKLLVLDPYDLILTKAQRAGTKDLEDARLLVDRLQLDKTTLSERFELELKGYLAVAPEKIEHTVQLWLEELF